MTDVPISAVRSQLAHLLNRVSYGGERIVIRRHGVAVAVLISMEDLAAFEALEDRADVEAARAALAESDERVPWEKVKAELNL